MFVFEMQVRTLKFMCVFCVRVDELVSVLLFFFIMLIYFLFTVCVYVFDLYDILTCVQFLVFCSISLSFAFKASDFQCLHCNDRWCLMLGSLQLYI